MTGPDGRPGDGSLLGVDLGTSHTVAMLRWPDGRTRPLLFDGQPLLPSAVYLDTTGRLHVGRDALRLGYAEPGRFEPNPKRHIDDQTVLFGGAEVPVADLLAGLLAAVAREAVAATGFLPPAVLTHPAAWGERRREVLVAAIAKAGWPRETQLLPEPVAAARYFADVLRRPVPVGSALAVFDFGGGTLDVAVVRNEGLAPDGRPRFVVASSGGVDDLGGLDLDSALVDHLGKSLAGAEPQAWQALTEPVTLAQWRARRQLWEDVRGAKEMLSRAPLAPVAVPGVEHAVHLTRDELEAAASPLISRGVTEAGAVIRAAGLTPRELAGLFLVGGSSRVPLVARLLHSELGIAPTVLEQPELPVAEGAIVAATTFATPTPSQGPVPAGGAVAAGGAVPAGGAFPAGGAVAVGGPVPAGGAVPAGGSVPAGGPVRAGGPVFAGGSTSERGPASTRGAVSAMTPASEGDPGSAAGPAPATTDLPATEPAVAPGDSGSFLFNAARPTPGAGALGQPAGAAAGLSAAAGESPLAAAEAAPAAPLSAAQTNPAPQPRVPSTQSGPPWGRPQQPAAQPPQRRPQPPTADSSAPVSPAPRYAEPVDPWATGEAAAFGGSPVSAEPWLASSTEPGRQPGSGGGPGASGGHGRAYKKRLLWFVAAAVVVVVGVATTLVVVLWPEYRALDFHPLASPRRVAPAVPLGSSFAAVAVRGDRAYFASVTDDGVLGVVAVDTGSGKQIWPNHAVGKAERWEQFLATPDAVVAFSARDSSTGERQMVLLDPGTGHELWHRQLGGDDNVMFSGDVAVLVDVRESRLLGLEVRGHGKVRWEDKNPVTQYGLKTTAVIKSTTVADDSGPASAEGTAFAAPLDDDTRIVQIGADRSAQVIDAKSGDVLKARQAVADPDDDMIAHNGRLIVVESDTVRRIVQYDLTKLDLPKVLYTAPNDGTRFEHLTECGADRVCFVQTTGYGDKDAQVTAVDVVNGGRVWGRTLAGVASLVPVGDEVLAAQDSSPAQVSLLDAKGKVTWTRPGVAARLDGGNLLLFSKDLSTSTDDPSLAGQHLGDDPVQLGPATGVRSSTCAWDTKVIACAADQDFQIQKFAG